MKTNAKTITFQAGMTALSVIALYVSSILPTGQLALIGIASLFGIAAVVEFGPKGGIFVYVCSVILGFLLVPGKSVLLFYVLFLGYYPVVKFWSEQCKRRLTEWCIKILVMNAALTVLFLAFSALVYSLTTTKYGVPVIYIAFNLMFVLYDIGVSRLIALYVHRIQRNAK